MSSVTGAVKVDGWNTSDSFAVEAEPRKFQSPHRKIKAVGRNHEFPLPFQNIPRNERNLAEDSQESAMVGGK